MNWLIDCVAPDGVKHDDIPWEAPTAQEAVDEFNKMNPGATLDCIKPGEFGLSKYSKTVPLQFDDECGYLTKETLERARQALDRTMDERMKDIFGLNGLEAQKSCYSIAHDFKAPEYIPPGVLCYIDDGVEEERIRARVKKQMNKRTWERVWGFHGRN